MTKQPYLYVGDVPKPVDIDLRIGTATVPIIEGWVYDQSVASWLMFYDRPKTTVVAWTQQPPAVGNFGVNYTISGTVTDSRGGPVSGTLELWITSTGRNPTWELVRTHHSFVGTTWSWTFAYGHFGSTQFDVRFIPAPGTYATPSNALSDVVMVQPAKVLNVNPASQGFYYCTFSWDAVPGASRYGVYNGGALSAAVSSATATFPSLSPDTQYNWRVHAQGEDLGGGLVNGDYSDTLYFNTGHVEQRDSASHEMQLDPVATGSYRQDSGGWSTAGQAVFQGYFSSPYNGAGYYGIIQYPDIYGSLVGQIGGTRAANFVCQYVKLWLARRSGVGAYNSNMNFRAHSSDSVVGSSVSGAWEAREFTMPPASAGGDWRGFDARLAQEFINYRHNSVIFIYHDSAHYAAINGKDSGAPNCRMAIGGYWNYVTVAQVNPWWWR